MRRKSDFTSILALAAVASVSGCDGGLLSLRTDERPVSLNMGGDRYVIPMNYLDSFTWNEDRRIGGDSAFVMAAWPEMTGRPKDGKAYAHYAQSNLAISVGPARNYERQIDGIEKMYAAATSRPQVGTMMGYTPPVYVGKAYGFDHFVRQFTPRERFDPDPGPDDRSDGTHVDIYVRYLPDGRKEAYMLCDGEPAPKGRNPQCELRAVYAEFPGTSIEIDFDRSEALHDVNRIERAVRAKLAEFKAAAVKSQAEGTFR
jgi:hypothetical protein